MVKVHLILSNLVEEIFINFDKNKNKKQVLIETIKNCNDLFNAENISINKNLKYKISKPSFYHTIFTNISNLKLCLFTFLLYLLK